MSAQVTEAHRELARRIMFEFTQAGTATASDVRMAAQIIADSEAKATERANAQVESLISSAKNAIPASEHPAEPTVENWAWQIRNLGDDRRLVCAERDQLRAELARLDVEKPWLKEANATVAELRAEVERLNKYSANLENDVKYLTQGVPEGDPLFLAVARAERAEAELNASRYETVKAAQDGLRECIRAERAEAELHALRLVCGTTDANKFLTWVDRANAKAEKAEAELAKAKAVLASIEEDGTEEHNAAVRLRQELATERARLDWLMAGGVCMVQHAGGFHVSRLHAPVSRAHIDAAIKEETK